VFSTFPLRTAYHQIKIVDSDANGRLYEFTRIPFGVKNGVVAFQRTTAQFIEDTFAYLDNVTVAGRDKEEHGYNLKAFLEAIRHRKFTLNENKPWLPNRTSTFLDTLLQTELSSLSQNDCVP